MTVLNPPPSYTVTVSTGSYFSTGSITIPSNYVLSSNGNNGGTWTTNVTSSPTQATLDVSGNADIKGKLTVQGKDIGKILEAIEKRLAILTPNPNKLEKFEALKKAYDHYKLLEALCHEDEDDGK
jgi:hypothetical protein